MSGGGGLCEWCNARPGDEHAPDCRPPVYGSPAQRDERTLGEVAYAAYRGSWGGGMAWELLDRDQREAWGAAAVAVAYRADELQRRERLPGMTTVAAPTTLDTVNTSPGSRRIEPTFAVRAGDQIGLSRDAFRVWRNGDLVADYAADEHGVLRPVTS